MIQRSLLDKRRNVFTYLKKSICLVLKHSGLPWPGWPQANGHYWISKFYWEIIQDDWIYISTLNFYRLMHNLFNSWTWTYLIIILNNRIWTATAAPLIVWLLNDSHIQRHADDRVRGVKLNISPYMSVWFRPARTAHYCEMCNCPRPQSATHTHTHT